MSDDLGDFDAPRRGTAILVITMVIIGTTSLIVVWPKTPDPATLHGRVAIIDSGIDTDVLLASRMVAEKSFITRGHGYAINDNSTTDSRPLDSLHGTHVARIIASNAPNVALVNAKVVNNNNFATLNAIISAIHWAVEDAECNVINLSLGGKPTNLDALEASVKWAFSQGVSIVAAAGNDGDPIVSSTSIESPAVYLEVIAVAAVDEYGEPYHFSATGPLRNRTAKPDISALGKYSDSRGVGFGTSFAAPYVTAAAANVIVHCAENSWSWTPGMIKALLMVSAQHLPGESWEVGAGFVDSDSAIQYLENVPKRDNLPLVAFASPQNSPYSFEKWFVNSTATLEISVFMSDNSTFELFYHGSEPWVRGPPIIEINQTGSFNIQVKVIGNEEKEGLRSLITLVSEDYLLVRFQLDFDVFLPIARVAFDISHTPWWLDSIYGQFRALYEEFVQVNIAVEEIREPTEITFNNLVEYDAIFIMDPCARDYDLYGRGRNKSFQYSLDEIAAYYQYWSAGGGLMVVALNNRTLDVSSLNDFLSVFNITLNYDRIPSVHIVTESGPNTVTITEIVDHPITYGVSSFDFIGCSMNYSGSCQPLAWAAVETTDSEGLVAIEYRTVFVSLEGVSGGKLLVIGSNYCFDNWGMKGYYTSDDNDKLARQCVFWLISDI